MEDYQSIVQVQTTPSPINDTIFYLVKREGYYLLCQLQEEKLTANTLKKILEWMVDFKMAIQLSHMPHHLIFCENMKNMKLQAGDES